MKKNKLLKLSINYACACFAVSSCFFNKQNDKHVIMDLQQIIERDTLTVVTLNTSISYFIYKMQAMGYEYELVRDFANSLGVDLEVKIAENITRLEAMLQTGEANLVAYPIQMDNAMKQKFLFCGIEQQNHLVIVQRANRGDTILNDVTQLIGKEVWTREYSRYGERLASLNAELGSGVVVHDVERDTVTVEDLIGMVAGGKIRYTVSDNHLAKLNQTYYNNIDTRLQISFPQRAMWIAHKNSPQLAQAVNYWAANVTKGHVLRAAAKRYFERSKEEITTEGLVVNDGQISPYDDLFRFHATNTGWDWRLLASIAYQESRFNNCQESWAGAVGLLGVMPRTAQSMGFSPESLDNPDISIQAGVACMSSFKQYFTDVADSTEQTKFTLAAYNAGVGHVSDARNLTAKYGKNPCVWDGNVAEYVRLKSEPKYYNDSICRYGYLRGIETFRYVKEVMERYKFYLSALERTAQQK